ncbi:MAG: hypothetical protein IBX39_06665 [Candidatus Methanoperedenaceae archaeon]|nr:hypothetical protein [Candidatus Methanoperedenaceae archaeon]
MIQLEGTITALSPLHLGSGRSKGTFIPTLPYIPGRTLRGMAGYYLFKNDRELFNDIGIDEENDISKMGIIFKNSYPVNNDKRSVFSPSSVEWCKKCGNLLKKGETECDAIVDGMPCLNEGKKFSGLMDFDSHVNKKLSTISGHFISIETKCPITRNGHTSMPENSALSPYHVESIGSGAKFRFRLLVKDEFADRIKEAFDRAGIFYGIGGFRSRGYGNVKFEFKESHDVEALIEKRAGVLSGAGSKLLVANSDMVIREGDYSIVGFDEHFLEYAQSTLESLGKNGIIKYSEPVEAKVSEGTARGWSLKQKNSLSEIIRCIGAGSCVRISGDGEAMAVLETFGIGEMINCGYGDVYFTGDAV